MTEKKVTAQDISAEAQDSSTNGANPTEVVVQLEIPIKRGEGSITSITLRRPNAGALRGLSLVNVAQMEVSTMQKLLPRISSPALTETDIALHLDVADLTALCVEVASFLVKKADLQASQ